MILNVVNGAPSVPFSAPLYTYTGTKPQLKIDGSNWEMAFVGDCDITFQRINATIDVFLVGGGAPGAAGSGTRNGTLGYAVGGKGGNGGERKTVSALPVSVGTKYSVRIGGSGQSTNGFGKTAAPGSGTSNGGAGAKQSGTSSHSSAEEGTDGGYAFATADTLFWPGYKYSGTGGGGGANNNQFAGWDNGEVGGMGYTVDGQERRSGGHGGTESEPNGKPGQANGGGGGGGGASDMSLAGYQNYPGGKGGSGIVIIRNHRT